MENKELKKVQECEIEMLKLVDEICRKYDLTYFAIGGTALGAVRHNGMIPWDDDIDIAMPREDYNKFLKVLEKDLPEGYHVQNFFTEPKTPFYFTKIRKDNTLFVEYYLRDYPIHHGIFIDIFPFDNVPENEYIKNVHYHVCRFLYQLFLAKSLKTVCSSRLSDKVTWKLVVRKTLHYLLVPVPKSWLFWTLDRSVQMFNKKDAGELSHIVRRRLRVKNEDLYPIKQIAFGDTEIAVPNHYDAYLKGQFGKYEILPPKEKRYGHLPYRVKLLAAEGE